MDPVRAGRISQELIGQRVGGWNIHREVGSGKSAVVFEGEKDGKQAALKIFDPELVERFGKPTQLARIERERILIGEDHPHVVQIFDGGECTDSGYLYVAMQFIDAPNLGALLSTVPRGKIATIIQQIASAARFLEEKNLAHRDIKPENIAVLSDFSQAILLDLGVLRPFGTPNLTDEDARVFVGTLRYSSPEFLLRTESDTPEGWRAITFYQLGAVLHDMIMQEPLFNEFTDPYALLVEAVQNETPEIHANDVPPDLVLLAQNCLVKTPHARISLVTWNDFEPLLHGKLPPASCAKERVRKRALLGRSQSGDLDAPIQMTTKQLAQRITLHLERIIRRECVGSSSCPPIELASNTDNQIQVTLIFAASPSHKLPHQLLIHFDCVLVDTTVMALSITASACIKKTDDPHGNPPSPVNVFRGPLESDSLTEQMQKVLWSSIDLAQRQSIHSASENDAFWLNLAQELEG